MTLDQLARHIHRRGLLAGLAAVAFPANARAFPPRCAEQGEGCTLMVRCCTGSCVTLPFNPNAGVCGAAVAEPRDPPVDAPTSFPEMERMCRQDPDAIDCGSFDCQGDAQAFLDAYPDDPCGLDGLPGPRTLGRPGVACEDEPFPITCPTDIAQPARRRRRIRQRRWRR